jgi:hypothetical protein
LAVLGCLLLFAASAKAYQLHVTPVSLAALIAGLLLVSVELFLGMWIAFGAPTRRTWYVAVYTFVVLAVVSGYKLISGEASCGCFGALQVSPAITLGVNAAALLTLSFCRPLAQCGSRHAFFTLPRVGLCALVPFIAVSALVIVGQSNVKHANEPLRPGDLVVLEPETWIGAPFDLLRHIEVSEDLATGEWTVLFYRSDCHVCHEVMTDLASQLEAGAAAGPIALVAMDMPNAPADALTKRLEELGCVFGSLSRQQRWFVTTPLRVLLTDGLCVKAHVLKGPPRWREFLRGVEDTLTRTVYVSAQITAQKDTVYDAKSVSSWTSD